MFEISFLFIYADVTENTSQTVVIVTSFSKYFLCEI